MGIIALAPWLAQKIAAANRDVPKSPPGPKQDCSDVVHLAFFFDGTGNNRDEDAPQQRWSNVARLFDAAMADPSKGIYRFYVSGVGTPYNGESSWVDKPDVWLEDHALGGAFGAGGDRRLADGESRMNQALHQALINSARKTGGEVKEYVEKNRKDSLNDLNKGTGGVAIKGQTAGASVSTGIVGEVICAQVTNGGSPTGCATNSNTPVSLTRNTATNITSMSLTAGDYDVWGNVVFLVAGTTIPQNEQCAFSQTSATLPTPPNQGGFALLDPAQIACGTNIMPCGYMPLHVAATTTVYLTVQAGFTTSTMTGYGYIGARRRD